MKIEKALTKLKQNKRNWRIEKLITIASSINIECTRSNSKCSHHVFRYSGCPENLSIPESTDIHPDYITRFIRLIEKVLEIQNSESTQSTESTEENTKKVLDSVDNTDKY